jgi:hypothetical protein
MAPRQQQQPGPEYLDEHHQRISEFAGDYFDDDEEREAFVSELMTRRGYRSKTRTDWEPPEDTGDDDGKGGGKAGQGGQRARPAYFKR